MDDVLKVSDFVSVHVPLLPSTKEMINKEFLSKMKNDAVLINMSRGGIMNDSDLLDHLDRNPNFWFGADAHNNEPKLTTGTFVNELA